MQKERAQKLEMGNASLSMLPFIKGCILCLPTRQESPSRVQTVQVVWSLCRFRPVCVCDCARLQMNQVTNQA
jgi:hypothetical protein